MLAATSTMAAAIDEAKLTSDAITADYRIWQRRGGHRYSLDDVATAWEAAQAQPAAARVLDLGCGVGSVLLMLAWKLKQARLWGIEAEETSAALARRSLGDNGLGDRAEVLVGDLRVLCRRQSAGARSATPPPFDLVTGTPPYLPLGSALVSPDPQRAAARIELRGGVEDYLAAAGEVLARDGRVVVCADGRHPERVLAGAAAAALEPHLRRDVLARAGARQPLFSLWVLGREPRALAHHQLVVRGADGGRTEASLVLRRFFGL
jgi:tRNA1(Val) A37 N6-methylase TrmN6